MLTVRQRGGYDVELDPELRCGVCQTPMRVMDAWLAFPAPSGGAAHAPGVWVHRTCVDGQVRRAFGTPRVTLWQARDYLERLLRLTEEA